MVQVLHLVHIVYISTIELHIKNNNLHAKAGKCTVSSSFKRAELTFA